MNNPLEVDAEERSNFPAAVPLYVKAKWQTAVPKGERSAVLTVLLKKFLRLELSTDEKELAEVYGC